jgi:CRISPR/Cas system CSM-associated protein Csm4 (group 5 of RAMP superfamily)
MSRPVVCVSESANKMSMSNTISNSMSQHANETSGKEEEAVITLRHKLALLSLAFPVSKQQRYVVLRY